MKRNVVKRERGNDYFIDKIPKVFTTVSVKIGPSAVVTNDPNFSDLFPVHATWLSQISYDAPPDQLYPMTQLMVQSLSVTWPVCGRRKELWRNHTGALRSSARKSHTSLLFPVLWTKQTS